MTHNSIRDFDKKTIFYLGLDQNTEMDQSQYVELLDVLRFHEHKYYVENQPLITDREFDLLFQLTQAVETSHPEWLDPSSPTQRIGSDISDTSDTITHLSPMLSLANSYNADDLIDFDRQVKKALDTEADISYAVEPKYDGGSIVLVYENDRLVTAATRGNGIEGEDITPNMKALKTIPLYAPFSKIGIQKIELRGEALIAKKTFAEVNMERANNDLPLFANARNAATGGLRMKSPTATTERGIEAFIYQIAYWEHNDLADDLDSHFKRIQLLETLGFKVPLEEKTKCSNIHEVIDFCNYWAENRDRYGYEIDGMVVKVDAISQQEKIGSTAHHPKWAIAFKFKAKQARSILEKVEFQVGKTGSITPVAKITPTELAGVTISSISLHNEDFIQSKDIQINDTILIERAGDVIPYIVQSFPELRQSNVHPIEFPNHCPVCDTALVRAENESAWRCLNSNCEAQVLQKMIYHVSKDAMDIEGLGKSNIIKFFELGLIKDISDIYKLDYSVIQSMEGFGEKSAQNIENSVNKAKQNPLHRLLLSLSIHHLGKKAAKIIAAEITSIFELQTWDLERFQSIKDIGPVLAGNVIDFFNVESNVELLRKMETYGVNMKQLEADLPIAVASGSVFENKTILFTGSLQLFSRKEAQELAAQHGAKVISAVSGKLDILVVGEKPGSKLKKAQALGSVEIMTEEDFKARIDI